MSTPTTPSSPLSVSGRLLQGQQWNPTYNIPEEFTELSQVANPQAVALIGTSDVEVTPTDGYASKIRTWNASQITAALAGQIISYATKISLDLPDELISLTSIYSTNSGDGASSETGTGGTEGTFGSLALSLRASGQGSASIQPDLQYQIKTHPRAPVNATVYVFFVDGNTTLDGVLSTLSGASFAGETVLDWPLFFPVINSFTLIGQTVSLSATADVQERIEFSTGESSTSLSQTLGSGTGYNYAYGSSVRTLRLPPLIHGAIDISSPTQSASASASASVEFASGTNWSPETATESLGPVTVEASISPTGLLATAPSAVPTSGLYLVAMEMQTFILFGNNMVHATVINASQFA